jgi:hypothetical protein
VQKQEDEAAAAAAAAAAVRPSVEDLLKNRTGLVDIAELKAIAAGTAPNTSASAASTPSVNWRAVQVHVLRLMCARYRAARVIFLQEQRRKGSGASASGTPREDATPTAERKHGASGIKTGHAFLDEDDRWVRAQRRARPRHTDVPLVQDGQHEAAASS